MSIRHIDSKQYLDDEQLNLLDLVLPATTADTNIHTFVEFKEWMNTSFKPKTQLNSVSSIKKNDMIVRSLKVRPSKSLVSDNSSDQFLLGSVKRRPSINFQGLGLIEESKEGMESSYRMGQSKQSPKKGSNHIDWGMQLNENSIAGSKSAHSSRSFNGYEQINQYQLKQRLGKGSFAEVFLAIDTTSTTDQKYAVKVLDSKQIKKKFLLKKSSQAVDSLQSQQREGQYSQKKEKQSLATIFMRNQVAILKKMNHQYITKLFDVIIDKQKSKIYLVLQYCGGGFINESTTEKGAYRKLLESECKRFYRQLGLAMDYIHNVAKIAHRDLKPENLLINKLGEVKISDFGLGTHKMKGKKQSGTPVYMPPQSFTNQGESYSQPGDIWALGVTLLVLLTGRHPQFINQRINVSKEISSLKDISENCKQFIRRCLQSDPEKRMKASEILEQAWLAGNQSESFSNLRTSIQNYQIQISPAEQLNVFKDIEKKTAINIFKISVD